MIVRPCPEVSTCPPDDPIGNYSSEADDSLDYISTRYAGATPPLLQNWTATSCAGTFISSLSQFDADLQAQAAALYCLLGKENPGAPIFLNRAQVCCVPCADGSTACITVPGGIFPALNQDIADSEAHSFACFEAASLRLCVSHAGSPFACINQPYAAELFATGVVSWALTGGSLPPGVTLIKTPTTLTISGTPTTAGEFVCKIRATSSNGVSNEQLITICVIDIGPVSATLPNGNVGTAYSQTFTVQSCAAGGSWGIALGTLPPGLTLNASTGVISGTPTTNGSYMFTVAYTTP